MAKRVAVVVSQGLSHHPAKRRMEEEIVASLLGESSVDVTVIPHLYDLKPDGSAILCLQGIAQELIVLSWMFPRATRWILGRHGVLGQEGASLLDQTSEDEEEQEAEIPETNAELEDAVPRVIESIEIPKRKIYCLNLASAKESSVFVDEIRRIVTEAQVQPLQPIDWLQGKPKPEQVKRMLDPAPGNVEHQGNGNGSSADPKIDAANVIEEATDRRWYPVIDMSRCTNCMECIDFCLFGVYGIDQVDTILVEQPDNCRKGCPACSRVCPENAILFPQHKTPAIAGSGDATEGLKIDLSKLFGSPEVDAVEMAVRERDEQLLIAGRDTVGDAVGIAPRTASHTAADADDLDRLIDQLDALDL